MKCQEMKRERERRLIHNCGRETTNDEDTTVLQEGGWQFEVIDSIRMMMMMMMTERRNKNNTTASTISSTQKKKEINR